MMNLLKKAGMVLAMAGILVSCGTTTNEGNNDGDKVTEVAGDPVVGTWQASEIKMGEEVVPADKTAGVSYTFTDKTYEIKRGEEVSKGTWKYSYDKDAILLVHEGSTTETYDENLRIVENSDKKMKLTTYATKATFDFEEGLKSITLEKK